VSAIVVAEVVMAFNRPQTRVVGVVTSVKLWAGDDLGANQKMPTETAKDAKDPMASPIAQRKRHEATRVASARALSHIGPTSQTRSGRP
jgi:hypothetical protein